MRPAGQLGAGRHGRRQRRRRGGQHRRRGRRAVRSAELVRQQRRGGPAHQPAGGDRAGLGHRLRGELPGHVPDDPAGREGHDRRRARGADRQLLLGRQQPRLGRGRRLREQPGRDGELQPGRGDRAGALRDPGQLRQPRPDRHPAQAAAAGHGAEPRPPDPVAAAGPAGRAAGGGRPRHVALLVRVQLRHRHRLPRGRRHRGRQPGRGPVIDDDVRYDWVTGRQRP